MGRRPPERIALERLGLGVGPPENEPDIHTTGRGAIENIKSTPPAGISKAAHRKVTVTQTLR